MGSLRPMGWPPRRNQWDCNAPWVAEAHRIAGGPKGSSRPSQGKGRNPRVLGPLEAAPKSLWGQCEVDLGSKWGCFGVVLGSIPAPVFLGALMSRSRADLGSGSPTRRAMQEHFPTAAICEPQSYVRILQQRATTNNMNSNFL